MPVYATTKSLMMASMKMYLSRLRARHVCRLASGFCFVWVLLLSSPATAQIVPSFGGDRAGTSGFQFLKIPVDARSAALGETVAANAFDASSLFWNPALAAQTNGLQVGFNHTAYFVDVSVQYASVLYNLNRAGLTVGASLHTLNSGDMDVTTEFQPFGTGESFSFVGVSGGLTVAQSLTDLFSYGVTAKYVRESVAGLETNTLVFDIGVFYRVGTTGAQMAVAIRNFGLDGTPEGEIQRTVVGDITTVLEDDFESVTPPTTFLMGFTYNVFQNSDQHNLMVSGQLTNPNDNAENWNAGVEYVWNETLILRTGYRFGIEEYTMPSFGVGLIIPYLGPDLRFDYGFSRLERLGSINRIGLNLEL